MKVSVIIPVYNESDKLAEVIRRVVDAELPEECEKEIVIVDDGSTDGTTPLLDRYRGSQTLVIHHSVLNFGKGTAVRIGIQMASGDVVLIQDGDLEYDPNDYRKILEPILRGEATVVYGSRFLGRMQGMKWANWVANKVLTFTANLLYGARITDEATAYKAFRSEVLGCLRLECRRFEFCPEVTAKVRRLGHRIAEVPISYNARGIAEGKKIRWQDGVHAVWTLVRWRVASRRTFVRSERTAGAAPQLRRHAPLAAVGVAAGLAALGLTVHFRGASVERTDPAAGSVAVNGGLVKLAPAAILRAPKINQIYPSEAALGMDFNVQPDGESAIAIEGAGFAPGARVSFDGRDLQTAFGDPGHVSAIVPRTLLLNAKTVQVSVRNPDSQISPPVVFRLYVRR